MSVDRKLAAIMFTDIVGFTQMMGDSEDVAIDILGQQDSIFNPLLDSYNGNLLKKMGDGLLIEFPSAVQAVECAINIQSDIKKYNESAENEFHIRIGIHLGDVLTLGDDVLGDGVNIASRIEPLAAPDGICITEAVQQSIKSKVKVDARRVTEVDLKHIDDKYTLYKIPKESTDNYEADSTTVDNGNVDINSIYDITNTKKEFFHTLKWLMQYGIIPFYIIFNVIPYLIVGDYSGLSHEWTSKEEIIGKFASSIFLCIVTFLFLEKTYKISFKDIRNIPLLLDVLILNMNYKLHSRDKNEIKYLHKPKVDFMVNPLKDTKFYPKALTDADTISVTFDGNTVTMTGMAYFVNKTLKKIKKRDINN